MLCNAGKDADQPEKIGILDFALFDKEIMQDSRIVGTMLINRSMDGCMDGWMDRWKDGWIDGGMDR